jgi:hypothetical protein
MPYPPRPTHRAVPDFAGTAVGRYMHRGAVAVTGLLMVALLTGACSVNAAGAASADKGSFTAAPFLVPRYPTERDADVAFVSQVAALPGVRSYLTGIPDLYHPTNLNTESAELVQRGRQMCVSTTDGVRPLAAPLEGQPLHLDAADANDFVLAAAAMYCPRNLADLGMSYATRGGLRVQPVTPRCPARPTVTVSVTPLKLSGESNAALYGDVGGKTIDVYDGTDGDYTATWSYTLTNASSFDAVVTLEGRVLSPRYNTDWSALTGDPLGLDAHGAYYVPAHQKVTETGELWGAFAWTKAEYRITTWLPVACEVSLQ